MKALFSILGILFLQLLCAQGFRPRIDNYTPKDYGRDHTPENWCSIQDTNGLLFFGNGNGVLSFNGNSWDFIPIKAGTYVVSMALDARNNRVLIGASGEFGFIEQNNNHWVYRSLSSELEANEVSIVWKSFVHNETYYFQSESGIFTFKDGILHTIEPESSFHTSFLVDEELYVRQRGHGLYQLVEDSSLQLISDELLFKEYGIFGILSSDNDSLLIISQEMGFFKMDPITGILRGLKNTIYTIDLGIVNVIRLADQSIALSTLHSGVVVLDKDYQIESVFDNSHGMVSKEVKHLLEDQNGLLWASTKSGVSAIYNHFPISHYNENAGLLGAVETSITFGKYVFVGTNQGLFYSRMDGRSGYLQLEEDLGSVWSLKLFDNVLWIGSDKGLFHMDKEFKLKQLSDFAVNAFEVDMSNSLIILGGANGIYVLDLLQNEKVLFSIEKSLSRVSEIEISRSKDPVEEIAWIGIPGYGLMSLRLTDGSFQSSFYSSDDGLNTQWVTPLRYHGDILFATDKGLQKFIEFENDSLSANLNNGYFDEYLLSDSSFRVPFTDLVYSKLGTFGCIDNRVHFLDSNTGKWLRGAFKGINADRINSLHLGEDHLWISSSDGLIAYHLPFERIDHAQIALSSFSAQLGDSAILSNSDIESATFPFESNDAYFAFSSNYYPFPEKSSYSYYLEGYDKEWSKWSGETQVRYTNLPQGRYQFKVKPKNIYGTEGRIQSISFSIEPPWYQTSFAKVAYGLAGILILFGSIKLNAKRLEIKNKQLQDLVDQRTKEISEQNEILQEQKAEIEEQNQEITDSIQYAKRIQEAILPPDRLVAEHFGENGFVLYKPKHIVAGDFYWLEPMDDRILFAAADCTGHGVPGAMVSVICSDALSRSVHEFHLNEPQKIMDKTRELVLDRFEKSEEEVNDGMDLALCSLADNKLSYAGAHNPLWIIRNGTNEIEEYKADKQPVGNHYDPKPFTLHQTTLDKGDTIYIFSDGIVDQFGGPKGKKLKSRPFKEYLISIQNSDMTEQKVLIDQFFEDWRGTLEQVDDVCLIGFRV